MTLVELVVGMVVSLLIGLAAAGSAQMFTASQRQAMSAGAASMNVTSTLSSIKNDISVAGLGFFGSSKYLCDRLNLSVDNTMVSNGTVFSPIRVQRDARYDTVEIVYANDVAAGANVKLRTDSTGVTAQTRSLLPVDLANGKTPTVLMAPATVGLPCTVRTVTSATPADPDAGFPQTLTFGPTGRHNQRAFANPPNYAEKDVIAVLGDITWHRYRVDATGQLIVDRVLAGDSAVLANNVIAFRVDLGVAPDTDDTRLDSWVGPGPLGQLNNVNIKRVRALRIGVLTRSRQPEKADADGVCRATTAMPKLFPEDAAAVQPDLPGTEWQCYRYRSAQVIVPLRNVVW